MGVRRGSQRVTIEARPGPLTIAPQKTAVIVVDMQNDFGAENGMFARAGMTVVYLKMGFAPDLANAGDPGAPNLLRHLALGVGEPVTAPDGRDSLVLIENTWNTDILPELTPQPGDLIVNKHRYSGFFETELDAVLKERGIEFLVFTGCTTSVCVESTLRDAFFRDYRCLLLADCTAEPIGRGLPRDNHEATLLLIELMFGWVSDSAALEKALSGQLAAVPS